MKKSIRPVFGVLALAKVVDDDEIICSVRVVFFVGLVGPDNGATGTGDSEYEKCYAETVCRSGSDPEWLFISLQR